MRLLGEIFLPSRNQVTWGWGKLAMRGARMTAASPWDTLCCVSPSSKLPMSAGRAGEPRQGLARGRDEPGDTAGSGPRSSGGAGWRLRGWAPLGMLWGLLLAPLLGWGARPAQGMVGWWAAPACRGLCSQQDPSQQHPHSPIARTPDCGPLPACLMGASRMGLSPGTSPGPNPQPSAGHIPARPRLHGRGWGTHCHPPSWPVAGGRHAAAEESRAKQGARRSGGLGIFIDFP